MVKGAWIVALALVTPALMAAAPSGPDDGAAGGSTPDAATDTAGDGVTDDLESMLGQMSASDTVEVIVMADSPLARNRAAGRLGPLQIERDLPIIDGFSATATEGQIRGLARVPGVERVQPNGRVTATVDAAQRDHGTAEARAQYAVDGTGVGVCVADTGVDPAHEQLNGAKLVAWHDVIGSQPAAYDDQGHGTHVAAIAVGDGTGGADAATYGGVAPGADLYAVKVLDLTGFGTDAQVVAGIDWCANQPGVDIISMSLGSQTGSDGLDAMSVAADNAVTVHGKVVVAASGNTGDADDTVGGPGAAEEVLTVGASAEWSSPAASPEQSHGPYLAPFSSRGPTLDGRIKPDVVAPGVTVVSAQSGTTGGYTIKSGTSMATPFVAGLAALALDVDQTLTPAQIKALVTGTARDLGPAGIDNHWGAGLIDGLAVVAASDGEVRSTPIASAEHLVGAVADGGLWTHTFDVDADDLGHPIALTLLIDGDFDCLIWFLGICLIQDMEADLDVELRDPLGTTVQDSGCPLFHDCGSGGRQETIHHRPTVAGTYELRVFPFLDPGTGQAPGGSFEADLFVGSPPPPVLKPGGFGFSEGDSGSTVFDIPITLSAPSDEMVTVDYVSWPCSAFACGPGLADEGVDYDGPTPGTLTFMPGETVKTVPVTVHGDTETEPRILWGEWFFIRFQDPSSNAELDRSFFGLGIGLIGEDDA